MKKIFTLVAMALMAVGASAQTLWTPAAEDPGAGSMIIKGDLMTVETVFEGKNDKIKDESNAETSVKLDGKEFTTYMQVRVDAAPTAADPKGTDKGNGTPLVITAKKNVDITIYYRRQAAEGAYADNDGKDVKLVDQAKATAVIAADEAKFEAIDADYGNGIKTYKLDAGKTYTLWARGTTIRLYGISYQEGTGSSVEEAEKFTAGTYFLSYTDEPTVENKTLETMSATGTANNLATWKNGISIMIMRSDKGMSAGSNISIDGATYKTIKVSNGAQNLLTLPEGFVTTGITFYSYVNADDGEPYWAEIGGTTYDSDIAGGMKNFKDPSGEIDVREFTFPEGTQLNKVTFTNAKKQLCYVAKVVAIEGEEVTGIKNVTSLDIDFNAPAYNLAGQRVKAGFRGIQIQNGKKIVK